MKITFLGGGSAYVPIIVHELINTISIDEIIFIDKMRRNMEIIVSYCQKIVQGKNISLIMCDDLDQNVQGSDVLISIYRAGGNASRILDEKLGQEFGILGQESQGIGGFSSALRNIQVLTEYAPKIKKYSPNVLFLNITNPAGIVTYAAQALGLNAVGICDAPYAMKKKIAAFLKIHINQIETDYIGLNHLGWITDIRINGLSIMDEILDGENLKELLISMKQINIPKSIDCIDFIKYIHAIPSSYLSYYYYTSEIIEHLSAEINSRAEKVKNTNNMVFNIFEKGDISNWPDFFINTRGGYLLGEVIALFLKNYFSYESGRHVICVKNSNCFSEFPPEAIIETTADVKMGKIKAWHQDIVPHIRGLVGLISDYEMLTAEAALEGNRNKALQALTIHPLIREINKSICLLNKIIFIYKKELPKFSESSDTI